jgi:hypothetical protein
MVEARHGLIFDVGFLASGMGLALTAQRWLAEPAGPLGGGLLLAAFLAQMAGAYGKAPSLQARLSAIDRPLPTWAGRLLTGLLFLHFLFFTVVVLMGFYLLGWAGPQGWDAEWFWVPLAFGLAGSASWLVHRASRRPQSRERGDEEAALAQPPPGPGEWLADGLLWLSVTFLTYAFWDLLLRDLANVQGIGLEARSVILLATLSLLMLFFYLPSRYLFLVEDAASPWAWLRIWLTVMLPIGWMLLA